MTTIKQALEQAAVLQQVSDSWQLDGELLLASVIGKQREYLFTWPSEELDSSQFLTYQDYCKRRSKGEPVAYILGRQAFWNFDLKVNSSVLIPRPETELLVETAIDLLQSQQLEEVKLVDLGTGSGAIALALAANNRDWRLTAVDCSAEALAVAMENAEELALTNIEFRQASWCDGLAHKHFDLIAANPPYVERGDKHLEEGSLPFEPIIALLAEEGGLAAIRLIAEQSKYCLKKDSWLLIEHGFQQKQDVAQLLIAAGFENIECIQDLAKLDRLTKAQYCHQI